MMTVLVRRASGTDAAALGRICYEAFKTIAEAHGFEPDFESTQAAQGVMSSLIAHERFFDAVAEIDGEVVGSNFLDERDPISGVGPITVDPILQNEAVGRRLMGAVMERSRERGFAGVRLVQAGYHCRSLALYLKLGFEAREHLSCLQGPAIGEALSGHAVRTATPEDIAACDALCFRVHGHGRGRALADAVAQGAAQVVERAGRITGYATPIAYFGHAVGETNDDLKALIGAAPSILGPGVLVPSRNGELMRWCMDRGLRITQTLTLMSNGLYNEPQGAWLPSVLY